MVTQDGPVKHSVSDVQGIQLIFLIKNANMVSFFFSIFSEADLEDRPTLQQLQILKGHGKEVKIISEAAYQWEMLAIAMGLNYPDIEKIKLDTNGAKKACLCVFVSWLEGNTPRPISWEQLLECLQDADLSNLAEKIRHVHYGHN